MGAENCPELITAPAPSPMLRVRRVSGGSVSPPRAARDRPDPGPFANPQPLAPGPEDSTLVKVELRQTMRRGWGRAAVEGKEREGGKEGSRGVRGPGSGPGLLPPPQESGPCDVDDDDGVDWTGPGRAGLASSHPSVRPSGAGATGGGGDGGREGGNGSRQIAEGGGRKRHDYCCCLIIIIGFESLLWLGSSARGGRRRFWKGRWQLGKWLRIRSPWAVFLNCAGQAFAPRLPPPPCAVSFSFSFFVFSTSRF